MTSFTKLPGCLAIGRGSERGGGKGVWNTICPEKKQYINFHIDFDSFFLNQIKFLLVKDICAGFAAHDTTWVLRGYCVGFII